MIEVKLIAVTQPEDGGDPIDLCERAARVSTDSASSKSRSVWRYCYDSGHHSIMEHAVFSFEITGVSRALLAQMTRHRVGISFTVRSQRYCVEDGGASKSRKFDDRAETVDTVPQFPYVTPPSIAGNESARLYYEATMKQIASAYDSLLKLVPPQDARFVLPNACETKIICTCNVRALMHFCNERMCTRAQWEIRDLAKKMREAVVSKYPDLGFMLVPKCEVHAPYCFCTERQSCGRHPQLSDVYSNVSD